MFSSTEKNRRLKAATAVMEEHGLSAIYLPGNNSVGFHSFGCQRYFTDSRVVFFIRSVVLLKDKDPIAVVNDLMGKLNITQSSFISDAVINEDQVGGVIEILRTHGIENGRVGTVFEVLPASWLIRLREEFPDIEFDDVSDELLAVRSTKSGEEIEVLRAGSRISDAGYKALCDSARPGVYENEVVAEIDKAMQRMGAEESFALITSGKFSIRNSRLPTLHNYTAFNRKIEAGDVVSAEITPRYRGYWTQIVRTVCVGERNEDADEIRRIIIGSIDAAKPLLKPKIPVCDVVKAMREYTEAEGYRFVMPLGHFTAVDLNEGDLEDDTATLLEPGMLIVLHPTIITDEMDTSIFWGESYIITEDGFEAPMQNGEPIFTAAL